MTEASSNQPALGGDVFVSYASQDAAVANSIVESLESQGLKCWIAPRDVKPGAQYADAIVRAINEAKAVVLVMSASAVASSHVGKEVERASSKRKPIIAFRIDAAPLNHALEYFLSESQWIDVPALGMPAALARSRRRWGRVDDFVASSAAVAVAVALENASAIVAAAVDRSGRCGWLRCLTFGRRARQRARTGGTLHFRQVDCGAAVHGYEREEGSGVFCGWDGGGDHRSAW